jgi:hypothetical protein
MEGVAKLRTCRRAGYAVPVATAVGAPGARRPERLAPEGGWRGLPGGGGPETAPDRAETVPDRMHNTTIDQGPTDIAE